MVITLLSCMLQPADWIAIVNILATVLIGYWIGSSVQNNLSTNRALKEYYIEEIKNINADYASFMRDLYANHSSSQKIQEWFKVMHIKIETLQSSIVKELKLYPNLLAAHVQFKHYLTKTQDFNAQYQSQNLVVSNLTRNEILNFHTILKSAVVELIVTVNAAKK